MLHATENRDNRRLNKQGEEFRYEMRPYPSHDLQEQGLRVARGGAHGKNDLHKDCRMGKKGEG